MANNIIVGVFLSINILIKNNILFYLQFSLRVDSDYGDFSSIPVNPKSTLLTCKT